MDFFVMVILIVVGLWVVVWLLSKMPQPVQEVVRDAFRFLFQGR